MEDDNSRPGPSSGGGWRQRQSTSERGGGPGGRPGGGPGGRPGAWRERKSSENRYPTQPVRHLGPPGNRTVSQTRLLDNQSPRGSLRGGFGRGIPRQEQKRRFIFGFKAFQNIANLDDNEIIPNLNQKRQEFLEFLEKDIEGLDIFALVMKIISKICKTSFDELKFKLILDICHTQFIGNLVKYLLELPYTERKSGNSLYWDNQEEFWNNLLTFCEYIITSSPSTAYTKYRSLIEAAKSCLNNLNAEHPFASIGDCSMKLSELSTKLSALVKKVATTPKTSDDLSKLHEMLPPDDFRWLNIVPRSVDFSKHVPFLRPNIVKGRYQDVEHYLDVQFRLLREDCFGPLREGVLQFKKEPNRRKYDNIRVFSGVKFIAPYITQGKVGCLVQIELKNTKNKNFAKTKWEYNKRFIFGSLLLFTKDDCRHFIAGTVLDRDSRLLCEGKIPVCLLDKDFDEKLYKSEDIYTMIESEVYFEPYYHVMKALQSRTFGVMLPMQQYIVHVQPEHNPPAYLTPEKTFVFQIERKTNTQSDEEDEPNLIRKLHDIQKRLHILDLEEKFCVLNPDTWPTKEKFNFDESQYEAYKHALTHEFAVIQGPPGTGKTFIGLQIARTLFQNLDNIPGCLMLVICYTNHALDQFLSGILNFTCSVARLGGQSKVEKFKDINLNKLRDVSSTRKSTRELYFERKEEVEKLTNQFRNKLISIDLLSNGVFDYNSIENSVPHLKLLRQQYQGRGDPLWYWLFEFRYEYKVGIKECLSKYQHNEDLNEEIKEETNKRKQKLLVGYDDYDTKTLDDLLARHDIITSFSLKLAERQLRDCISRLTKTNNVKTIYDLTNIIQDEYSQIALYKDMLSCKSQRVNRRIHGNTDFTQIPLRDRWALYFQWAEPEIMKIKNTLPDLQKLLIPAMNQLEETRMLLDLEVLRSTKVVGMTTTCAARLRKLITALRPPIVIIEEAAEVLEQHIVTSLTQATQHLILIGDHQQLRPSASHIKLARHYNLEVSLFERMISNGLHSRRLNVQHRMRPEIAALISPHIYPDLYNHDSVLRKPDVRGVCKNVFFFNHDFMEEEQIEGATSRSNHKEAELTMAMANYVIMQGYKSEDVTILTTYSGQMFYMRKERQKYSKLRDVKVTVVDNYQGEESKIILLSLVRNNEQDDIGFLGTENRICVALSRAQEGFYLFGNINILKKKSELWQKIATTLEKNDSLGSTLVLRCENHNENTTEINTLEDFEKVPEGGCLKKCEVGLKCGHKCLLLCHAYDRAHETDATKCVLPCESTLCELNHVPCCPLKCYEKCGPCNVLVKKTLPCGHDINMACHKDPEDPEIKCFTKVPCTLPACGHQGTKSCFQRLDQVVCEEPCIYRLECGHSCKLKCHVKNDPDHEKYTCQKPCQRRKKGCTAPEDADDDAHACTKQCYEQCETCAVKVLKKKSSCKHSYKVACHEDVDDIVCKKKCARVMPCGHFCQNKCYEPCVNCTAMVTKVIPDCGHEVRVKCAAEATRAMCKKPCERTLSCGHACKAACREACDPARCAAPAAPRAAPCGHAVAPPCRLAAPLAHGTISEDVLLEYCTEICGQVLACGHLCAGTCGTCHQGRLHVPCQQRCGRSIICGHECTEPCSQVCPPCNRPCEVKCAHSTCGKKCSEPCNPCKEKCVRACPHGACSRLCHEACDVAPCGAACARALACGHACRGLCGEPCPAACRACRPRHFPTGLIGEELHDDDRLIQLLDCGHILTVDDADGLMNTDRESIYIRKCPHCRTPIINTNRYKDIVNNTLKNEIGPIKKKIYGSAADIAEKRQELMLKLTDTTLSENVVENAHLKDRFNKLVTLVKQTKHAALMDLEMQLLYLNILSLTADCHAKYIKENSTELRKEINKQISMLCGVLEIKKIGRWSVTKISEQQQKDALNEIRRLQAMVQFSVLLSHNKYKAVQDKANVKEAVTKAQAMVFSVGIFDKDKTIETLKKLNEELNVSATLSLSEIQMIIKAVKDVPQTGHWFKCPNGHFYAIGECGGAMEVSRCVDCGAAVGGQQHTLLTNNAHASELDGSRFPKWSEQYNNMANFNFD